MDKRKTPSSSEKPRVGINFIIGVKKLVVIWLYFGILLHFSIKYIIILQRTPIMIQID